MDLVGLVSGETRVLEVGAENDAVARSFAAAGCQHYLGLVPDDLLESVRAASPEFRERLHALVSKDQVLNNSADLLVLRRPYTRLAWAVRDLCGVDHVAVEVSDLPTAVDVRLARLVGQASGRITSLGRVTLGGTPFDVLRLGGERVLQARQYLSETMGVRGLLHELDRAGVRYAVLRWFETLPHLAPGEDLDVLVADEDLDTFRKILNSEPGTIPVDLYSESGLAGSDYHGMAYYPPTLASALLCRATRHTSGALVPAPRDHLNSLAYHAVYHKGTRAGIVSTIAPTAPDPEHDYAAALAELARSQGVSPPATLEGLDAYLADEGWQPPRDTLRRLADHNSYLRDSYFPQSPSLVGSTDATELPELATFFVRERTLSVLCMEDVLSVLKTLEFEVLCVRDLTPAARARCEATVRGGNWGRGPFALSGGGPVAVVVALHYGPRPPDDVVKRQYPRLTNADVLLAKNEVRDLVRDRTGDARAFNPVHSSDNEHEAWEYVEISVPEERAPIEETTSARKFAYRTEAPVRAVLSRGRRAKVEVLDSPSGPVVRKTFGAHARAHFERELRALQELGPAVTAIPEVCSAGDNWFTLPFFEDTLGLPAHPNGRLVPLAWARQMVEVLRQVHALGADLIDAKPQNFLLDPRHGLKLVDLEFCHRYEGTPPAFSASYSFAGVPEGFCGDVPYGEISYDARWRPFIGLSQRSLLDDPVWLQHAKRNVFRVQVAAGRPRRMAAAARHHLRSAAARGRSALGSRYRQWSHERGDVPMPARYANEEGTR